MRSPINHCGNDIEAVKLGIMLGVISAVFLPIFGSTAWMVVLGLQFVLPIPVCLSARTKLLPLSLIPNSIVNCWFVFIQAPRSGYWAGWRNEWRDSLIVFGLGIAASSIVAGLMIWRRKATEKY